MIKSEDLIFTNEIEDDRTNTYLTLNDYDWMTYVLQTRFKTKEMGVLAVKFEYFGVATSWMIVKQTLNDSQKIVRYEFPTFLFKQHIIDFLKKHIKAWNGSYAFNGEDEVITFFNDVIEYHIDCKKVEENGTECKKK